MDSLFWLNVKPPDDAENAHIWRDMVKYREMADDELGEPQKLFRAMAIAQVSYNNPVVRKLHTHLLELKKAKHDEAVAAAKRYLENLNE